MMMSFSKNALVGIFESRYSGTGFGPDAFKCNIMASILAPMSRLLEMKLLLVPWWLRKWDIGGFEHFAHFVIGLFYSIIWKYPARFAWLFAPATIIQLSHFHHSSNFEWFRDRLHSDLIRNMSLRPYHMLPKNKVHLFKRTSVQPWIMSKELVN